MKLPDRFQFRVGHIPGFTHSIKRNANGDYEVKWARGYAGHLGHIPNKCYDDYTVIGIVERGGWVVVEEAPVAKLPNEFYFRHSKWCKETLYKATLDSVYPAYNITWEGQEHASVFSQKDAEAYVKGGNWVVVEDVLPNEFYFSYEGLTYSALVHGDTVLYFWTNHPERGYEKGNGSISLELIKCYFRDGTWTLLDKKPLTAEQQRAVKEYKEQHAALDSSIKMNQQTISHHERLIGNYQARQADLTAKINEIEGNV